jgi:hypothetical protein
MFERIEGLVCWKCGVSLENLSLPLRRLEECRACGAELHACRLCEFFDPAVAKSCREPVAEEVKDKSRANFCDYFRPRPGAHAGAPAAEATRSQLEALFGGAPAGEAPADEARSRLEELFGGSAAKKPVN